MFHTAWQKWDGKRSEKTDRKSCLLLQKNKQTEEIVFIRFVILSHTNFAHLLVEIYPF